MTTHSPDQVERTDSRIECALTDLLAVKKTVRGVYLVHSDSNQQYIVDMQEKTCTCPDFEQGDGAWCKHMYRVAFETGKGIPGTCAECAKLPDDFPCAECHISYGEPFSESVRGT